MPETVTITAADVATVPASISAAAPAKVPNAVPNAVLTCVDCGGKTDKGCPPIPGQNDSLFKCGACQTKVDAASLALRFPTVELKP